MAVPKRKISGSRRGKKRAHTALTSTYAGRCPSCGAFKQPHRVCISCGTYKKETILNSGS